MGMKWFFVIFYVFMLSAVDAYSMEVPYTLEDRDRLVRVEAKIEQIEKRLEDINRRFEDMNKRFDQLMTFLVILAGIFTTLTLGVIGFAYWDRRTIIRRAKEEALEEIDKRINFRAMRDVLIELAKIDPRIEAVLKKYNIL